MARIAKIIIRINDQMKESFQAHAESLGMTASGLGAYVIGQWVSNQKRTEQLKCENVQSLNRP